MTAMWMSRAEASAAPTPHTHLEPGVRLLCQNLEPLGCRIYRGCEGHAAATDSALHPRRVAVVPRDDGRAQDVHGQLRRLAAQTNSIVRVASGVTVEIGESELRADSGPPHATIEIVFAPQGGLAAVDYFEHLAITYAEFCKQLAGSLKDGRTGAVTDTDLLSAVREFYDAALSWHCKEPATSAVSDGIAAKALHLHAMNFGLWHHEDAVRGTGVDDHEIARRKRRIDDLNAQRNAAIEDIDVTLLERVSLNPNAPLHTDTPGTIVDRLSVLALRILHTNRAAHPAARLALLEEQHDDLLGGLERFLTALRDGEIRFKLYRQFKSAESRNHCALFETRDL